MARVVLACAAALLLSATGAVADVEQKASKEEETKVKAAIAAIGCEADEIEKEDSGLFEIDDAKCKIGQYDIKLDKDFHITSMTRD